MFKFGEAFGWWSPGGETRVAQGIVCPVHEAASERDERRVICHKS